MINKIQIPVFLLLYLLLAGALSEYIPVVWPDEVLFFNPAQELSAHGRMVTSVLAGLIPGMENFTFWMPPLYLISLSGFLSLFGETLKAGRMFGSLIAILIILVMLRLARKSGFGKQSVWVAVLIATDYLFVTVTHSVRMEGLTILFGSMAILLFYEKTDIFRIPYSFSAGFMIALGFLSHPFGAFYSIILLYQLFSAKENIFRNLLYLFLGAVFPLLFWVWYIYPEFDLFRYQFGVQLSRKRELLETFGPLDRIKIIIAGYRFNYLKLVHLIISAGIIIYVFLVNKKDPFFRFIVVWLSVVTLAIFFSTESWYVVHLVPPLVFAVVYLYRLENKYYRIPFYFSLSMNVLLLGWMVLVHFFLIGTPAKTREYYQALEKEIGDKKRIYLQAIPDPYFYLKERHPDKILKEFIPGELSISKDYFMTEIERQDVFIFYNPEHMNRHVREYLEHNQGNFSRKIVEVPTGYMKDLKLIAVIYIRKSI